MNTDFRDLLAAFNAEGVDYLIVGAHALAVHGLVRATKDLDVWVRPSSENAARVIRALTSFGAQLQDLTESALSRPDTVFQIGIPPVRVDVMTAIEGVEFVDAWEDRVLTRFAGEPANALSREALLQNKRAAIGGSRRTGTLLSLNLTESCRLNDWMVQPKARCAGSGSRRTMPRRV